VDAAEIEKVVGDLEIAVDRLRSLYEQYFMGIEKMEPMVPRKDVDRRIQALRKEQIRNTAQRFRFQMILQRYNTYQTHWQRICREIENGTYKRHLIRARQRFGEGARASLLPPPASERTAPALARPGAPVPRELAAELAELDREFAPDRLAGELAELDREFAAPPPLRLDDLDLDELAPPPGTPGKPGPVWRKAQPGPPAPPPPAPKREAGAPPPLPPRPQPGAPRPGAPPPPRVGPPPAPLAAKPAPAAPAPQPAAYRPPPPAPTARVAPPRPAPAAAAAPPPPRNPLDLPDERVKQLYSQYVESKRQQKESTAAITYEAVAKTLRDSSAKLREKHGKAVDFEVSVKDGRTILKPVIK
jgi:hypothetical protein